MKLFTAIWKCLVDADWRDAIAAPPKKTPGGFGFPIPMEQVGGNLFRLLPGYRFPSGAVLKAPFISDGGSIPELWQIVTADEFGPFDPVFFEHDQNYWQIGAKDRLEADIRLRENLLNFGMSEERATIIYDAVRKFGDAHFGPESYPGESNDLQSPLFRS